MKIILYILGAIVAAPIALLVAVQLFCTIAFEWLDLFGGKFPAWTGTSPHQECTVGSLMSRIGSDSSEAFDVDLAALSEKYNQDLPRVENALWNWERTYPEGRTLVLEYKSPLVEAAELKQTLNLAKTKQWAVQMLCNSKDSAELIRKGVVFRKVLLGADDSEVYSLVVDSEVCNDQ